MNRAFNRTLLLITFVAATTLAAAQNCGCACCKEKPKDAACCCYPPAKEQSTTADAKRYPLRGIITAVHVDRSALMVKHEEIPGVMRAMTMLFKVDDATLESARKGQTITAQMSRQGDDWWLHDVKPVAAPAAR